jgi:predicted translation initiation factor SUI1
MSKPARRLLFVTPDRDAGRRAQVVFSGLAARFGMPWATDVRGPDVTPDHLDGVHAVVAIDLPEYTIPGWDGRVEHVASQPALIFSVTQLLARLLGGRDDAPDVPPAPPAPPKKVHTVKVSRETAGRRGKGVTVVSELPLTEDQLKLLATKLKTACGTGGTAKDGRVEIQGDHRDRLVTELEKLGYKVKRAGG